jgi:hypothetical protein
MRHIVTSFMARLALPYFSTLSHKRQDFLKKLPTVKRLLYCDVESKWKNYHIITFPG